MKQYGPTFGFLRGIYEDINITDEMFDLLRIKDVTSGEVIFQELEILMARFNLYFKRHGLWTDGAPAIIGTNVGYVSKIRYELASVNIDTKDISILHCIIHQVELSTGL